MLAVFRAGLGCCLRSTRTPSISRQPLFFAPVCRKYASMVSTSSSFDPPQSYGNFKLSAGPISLSKTYNIPVSIAKWTSDKTGLRVVLVDVEGPLVNLYASVSTEIFNDSGCPHTLEHLVFLGSEKYPYKGVLDTLANRAFARGTNAWTDTTNTTYTITTAGEEGFLRILPVYMDHLLYPTLTDAGFTTEVYHLNGKGEDAGVVYSEMQGRENQSWSLMELAYQRALYPEGSAYRSETGGLMDKLRVLTIDQIRDYHASYYLPHNTCLFVTGKIDPMKLLKVLTEEVEPSIEKHQQAKGSRPQGWKRPFVETPSAKAPKLKRARVEVVDFPEKDESMGEVNISWVGVPQKDHMTDSAINNLNTYLADSAISPLQKALIEIEEPFATDVSFNAYDQLTTVIQLSFSSVPTEKLQSVGDAARKVMQQIAEEGVDMERMSMLLDREQRKLLNLLEKDAAEPLTHSLLSDFLFGAEDGSDMAKVVDDITRVRQLREWSQQQWTDLLRKFYLDQPSLTIIGKPSAKLASQLEKAVADRLKDNVERLGEDGLKQLQEKVDHAVEANDAPIPPEMISSFKIPDVNSIRWIPVTSAGSGKNPLSFSNEVQRCLDADRVDLPYSIQFEHIQSNFVEVSVYMDAGNLAARKDLLALYIGSFHSLPVTRADGTNLTYEEVVRLLDAETVDYDISMGAGLSEQLAISVKVEKEQYPLAIRWLNDLLFGANFDVPRLRIIANKILQNLPSEKRDGLTVATGALREMTQDKDRSSATALSLLSKIDTAAAVMDRLRAQPEEVVSDLKQLRTALSATKGMRMSVAGDILTLDKPLSSWQTEFKVSTSEALQPVTFGRDCMSLLGQNPARKAMLIPLPTIESSYSYHVAKGPNDYLHPDLPAIMVARTAVNALEGLLWRNIRGVGLAYGCHIINDVERGLIYFRVFKSPDCGKAYVAAREAIQGMIEGKLMPLDELRIETAKSELAVSTADSASTMSDAAETSFVNQALKSVPQSYQRDLLAKCGSVTVAEANDAVRNWILPIFDAASSITVAVSSTNKADDVQEQLTKLGFEVETRTIHSDADSHESGTEGDEGEGDQSTDSWSEVEHSDSEQKTKS